MAPETPVTIADSSKSAVEMLPMIRQRIEACPKVLDFEDRWGSKKDEIVRFYQEAPANVIWNVVAGNSVRAPYLGYVEFTVHEDYWMPESAERNFFKWPGSVPTLQIAGPMRYRYEYDLGPDGIQLTRVLLRNKTTGEWADPNRGVIANHCWDSAARNTAVRVQENVAPSPQPAPLSAPVAPSAESTGDLKQQAASGDAVAQNNLGTLYGSGQAVPQDDAQQQYWFRKAAEQGDAVAQYNLGVLYEGGKGVPQDDAQAAAWYRRAAEQGYAVAQCSGVFYLHGEGVPQDYTQEAIWLRKAAEQGYATRSPTWA